MKKLGLKARISSVPQNPRLGIYDDARGREARSRRGEVKQSDPEP